MDPGIRATLVPAVVLISLVGFVELVSVAQTPLAGMFAAVGIALATLSLPGILAFLPKATLAATIMIAVSTLIDLKAIGGTFHFSKADFAAMLASIVLTLIQGVEAGILVGVGLSIGIFLYRPVVRTVQLLVGCRVPSISET
jgi:MFS superfamily sulfate permease-like transporter